MKVYHIKTEEPDPYPMILCEFFTLNSIYCPDKRVLVGFINQKPHRGTILNYTISIHYDGAQKIVDGNKEGVRGKVKETRDLYHETIEKIAKFGERFHDSDIYITKPFDGSIDCLIEILSGELKYKGFLGLSLK